MPPGEAEEAGCPEGTGSGWSPAATGVSVQLTVLDSLVWAGLHALAAEARYPG